jgi:predicted  nucleic acid-binding Zn-ribbon protein
MAAWNSKTKRVSIVGSFCILNNLSCFSQKLKKLPSRVACIAIPSLPLVAEEPVPDQPTQDVSSLDTSPSKSQLHIFERDPAKLELAKAEEARRRRKCNETLLALEKIQGRIDYTITEYEGLSGQESDANAKLELIEDANQLFRLLADPSMRAKYRQKLTVFIVGYEEKREELEGVLGQLHEFFEETKAGGTSDLLEEVSAEELDLDKATEELSSALTTAQSAVKRLVGIKKEMNHLVSIVAAYPDTNKGRKNMEKALMKAQDEVTAFSKNLDEVQAALKSSTEKCSQLQVQLDAKNQECGKLRKSADQVKLLQVGNEKLKRELAEAEKNLKETQDYLSEAKKSQQVVVQTTDTKQVSDLEVALAAQKSEHEKVVAEMEALVQSHAKSIEELKAEHEAESNEVRGRFEDQLKSLMEEDVFGDGDGDLQEVSHIRMCTETMLCSIEPL